MSTLLSNPPSGLWMTASWEVKAITQKRKTTKKNPKSKQWIRATHQWRETHQLYRRRCLISLTQYSAPVIVAVCHLIDLQLASDQMIWAVVSDASPHRLDICTTQHVSVNRQQLWTELKQEVIWTFLHAPILGPIAHTETKTDILLKPELFCFDANAVLKL